MAPSIFSSEVFEKKVETRFWVNPSTFVLSFLLCAAVCLIVSMAWKKSRFSSAHYDHDWMIYDQHGMEARSLEGRAHL